MFHHQSKPEKSEAQQRRPGRSTGVGYQQPPKGTGVGGSSPHSSSPSSTVKSSKRPNGPGGQPRGKTNAGLFEPNSNHNVQNGEIAQRQQPGTALSGTYGSVTSSATKQSNMLASKSHGILPIPSISQAANNRTLDEASPLPNAVVPMEASRAKFQQQPIAFQFGSLSSGIINGLQVPVRTNSAPPNFEEQKSDQVRFGAADATSIPKAPKVFSGSKHWPQQDRVVSKQAASTLDPAVEVNKSSQGARGGLPVAHKVQPSVAPRHGVGSSMSYPQIYAPSSQIQSQAVASQPTPVQFQFQMTPAMQGQVQRQVFSMQSLQPDAFQLQQGMVHQLQGLTFPQPICSTPSHAMPQQVNSMTTHIPSQQFSPIPSQQFSPMPFCVSMGTHLPTYMSQPANQYIPQRTCTTVKITHPETHEELKFGPKGTKLDSHTDTATVKLTSDTNTLSGRSSAYKPQSSPPVAFSGPHKVNSNSAMPTGSFGHSINLRQQSNTSVLVADISSLNATSVRSDPVHTSSGKKLSNMIQSGVTLDLSKPCAKAEETSLISMEVSQMKSSSSTSSTTQTIYGSTPSAISAAVSGDISGSQSTPVTELSAAKKSDAAVKNLPTIMPTPETIIPEENIISNSAVSASGLEQNNSFCEKRNSECIKSVGLSTKENMRKLTKSEQRHKKQQLQQQAPSTVTLHLSPKEHVEFKGESVPEVSLSSLGHCNGKTEKSLSDHISSPTSMATSSLSPQKTLKTLSCSAQKASSTVAKVDDMNVSTGATAELVRKALGKILPLPLSEHGSVVCPASLISDSSKTCEIFATKQTSGQKANHMAIPSLQKNGTSEPMSDISVKEICMGMSVSLADSRTATEFASGGEPLYSNSVGPLFNGEDTLEASLNEHDITDSEADKYFCSNMSLPTSMMSSSLVPQETITCSVENVSSDLDKVEDTNAYSVVTSELARKPLGKISQLSYGDRDFDESQSSLSNASLKDIEISPAKQMPRERSDNAIAPSLLATGATKPVADATSVDTSTGTPISQGDSSHLTKYASAGGPPYSETVGPMFDGIIEAPGPKEEIAVNGVKVISEGVDTKLGNMFDVSETSISLPSIQPNMEPDPCFRDMTLQNIESAKNNEIVSLNKDSIEDIHRGSEDSEMIEQVVTWHKYENKSVPHTMSTLTGVSKSNINNEMAEYFVNSESIITNEQKSPEVEQENSKMNHSSLEFQQLAHAAGMLVSKGDQSKEREGEDLPLTLETPVCSESSEQGWISEGPVVTPKPVVAALEGCDSADLLSNDKVLDSNLSLSHGKGKESGDFVSHLGECSTDPVNLSGIQNEIASTSVDSSAETMAIHHQKSSLPVEVEVKIDSLNEVTEEDNKNLCFPASSKVSYATDAAKTGSNKKKKKKEYLSKADAAAPTGDLYNAYKAPEEKQENVDAQEALAVVSSVDTKQLTSNKSENQEPIDLDDWEDAAELSTTVEKLDAAELRSSSNRKYSRDFLLTFRSQFKDLSSHVKIPSDMMEILVTPQVVASHVGEIELLNHSGNSHFDRRGSSAGTIDEDRWNKSTDLSGRDIYMEVGVGGPPGGFRPGQGFSPGFGRNARGMPTHMSGILSGGPFTQMPFPQSGLARSSVDADKWQRGSGFQKGLIPPPQTHSPAIHKTENRYEVGKVSDEEQSKQRKIKSILNKLTPQNFDRLFVQVKEVNIDSALCLTGVISQIFDKALTEPTFCEMYAKFCVQLAAELPEFYKDNEKVVFKTELLNKCQEEFERDEMEQAEADRNEGDSDLRISREEIEEKKAAMRRRMLGNIRFIGELYKEKMLTERIMHECIKKLLGEYQNPDTEHVEALCKLMSTIGCMIDHPKAKEHIDAYFDRMAKMLNNQKLPSRLKFMLRDIIDLRKNGWQQRRKVEGPKKIEEVHRDAVQERQVQGGRLSRNTNVGHPGRRLPTPDRSFRSSAAQHYLPGTQMGSYQHIGGMRGVQPQVAMHGFNSQDSRFAAKAHFDDKPLLMPLSHRPSDDSRLTLGPQGGLGKGMAVRERPSMSSGNSRQMNMGPVSGYSSTIPVQVLFDEQDKSLSRIHGAENPLHTKPVIQEKNSFDHERKDSRNTYPSICKGGMATSREFQLHGCSSQGVPKVSSEGMQVCEDRLTKMSSMAIKEFYSIRDMKEAAMCVEDLKSPWFHPTMVSSWLIDSFDRKDAERDALADLLIYLCKTESCSLDHEQLQNGLKIVLSSMEDTVVDAPRAPEFLGRILGKLVAVGEFSIDEIARAIKGGGVEPGSLLETAIGLDILGTVLDVTRRENGESALSAIYRTSGVSLEDFMPSGENSVNFEVFLEKKKIQCLYPPSFSRQV